MNTMLPFFLGNYLPSFGVLSKYVHRCQTSNDKSSWPLATEESYFIYMLL